MSLQSDYELSLDPAFRNKVTAATAKVALAMSDDEDIRVKGLAARVLGNVAIMAEQVCHAVAALPNVDTTANDRVIEDAVKLVLGKMVV